MRVACWKCSLKYVSQSEIHLLVGDDNSYFPFLLACKKPFDEDCRNARKREVYSVSCIGVLPFIEVLSETVQSGLVASSCDSEEHAWGEPS